MTIAIRFNLFNVFVALLLGGAELARVRRDVRRRPCFAVANEGLLKKGRLLAGRAINQLV